MPERNSNTLSGGRGGRREMPRCPTALSPPNMGKTTASKSLSSSAIRGFQRQKL
nr:MAG TPA: Bifunctional enzyme CysN/CysC [Caudoviricetes sp.]